MKFGFIAKHRGIWPAGWLCEALGVSRGGLCRKEGINQNLYYRWSKEFLEPSNLLLRNQLILSDKC